jgi:hypothetical protein
MQRNYLRVLYICKSYHLKFYLFATIKLIVFKFLDLNIQFVYFSFEYSAQKKLIISSSKFKNFQNLHSIIRSIKKFNC